MRSSLISAALATLLVAAPAQAGEPPKGFSDKVTSYAMIGSVASVVIVTSPVWLTLGASAAIVDGVDGSGKEEGKIAKAKPLPPLTVERVETKADGAVEVALKHPESPEVAVIQWPAREDSPGKTLKVGDVLDLTPTEAGAGWMVANAKGETLAFMPTSDAAKNQMSEAY
ncbi:hypothetical protein [Stenotrophomonas sp.]|uniref:hypothetical protein n=1 Tax=Stenotrophomonas sp. TaxID=69392 RepID=UPI0028A1C519|nr:hypothetical protein [Stenotrophomonas sp.]